MPYLKRSETETPVCYGLRLVVPGELVLVREEDVEALLLEGWELCEDTEKSNVTLCASDEV